MRTLRDARREKLISIETLSEMSGVSTKTIVETELQRSAPKLRTIKKLSEALDVPPLEIEEFAGAILEDDSIKKLAA